MLRQRTTPILVIAILHLMGGGLGLLTSLCACGSLLMIDSFSSLMPAPPAIPVGPGQPPIPPPPPRVNEVSKYLNDNVPGYRAFTIGSLALYFLLDIMLLSAGIGLLKMQPWARGLSLVYAPISILLRIASVVYQLVWVIPATQALFANMFTSATGFSSLMNISSGIGAVGSLLIIIYPIAVILVMLLPSTAAAFRGEIPIRDDDWPDDENEEDDEARGREPPPRSDTFRR